MHQARNKIRSRLRPVQRWTSEPLAQHVEYPLRCKLLIGPDSLDQDDEYSTPSRSSILWGNWKCLCQCSFLSIQSRHDEAAVGFSQAKQSSRRNRRRCKSAGIYSEKTWCACLVRWTFGRYVCYPFVQVSVVHVTSRTCSDWQRVN